MINPLDGTSKNNETAINEKGESVTFNPSFIPVSHGNHHDILFRDASMHLYKNNLTKQLYRFSYLDFMNKLYSSKFQGSSW